MKNNYSKLKCMIAGLFSASAFFISLDTPSPYESHIVSPLTNIIFELFEQLNSTFAGNAFLIMIIGLALTYVYWHFLGNASTNFKTDWPKGEKILSAFFAVMYTGGKAFRYNDSLSSLWTPKFNMIKALIIVFGFYYLYRFITRIALWVLDNAWKIQSLFDSNAFANSKIKKSLYTHYHKHPFIFMWILIVIAWFPHLICRYPGALSDDNWAQLNQYFGQDRLATNQPIIHTMTVGIFVEFGLKVLGSANVGLFIYCVIQAIAMAGALSYTLLFMKKWNTPKWFRILVILLYTVTPYFTGNAAWAIKDYPHMIGYVLWGLIFIDVVVSKKASFSFKGDKKLIILWIIGALLMASYRKNGLHIYIGTLVIWMVISIIKYLRHKSGIKISLALIVMLIMPVLLSSGLEKGIIKAFNVVEIKQQDMFSLPFQQTARYYHYYRDEFTQEEYEAIGDVLDYEWLYTDYHPDCSDSVKAEYHAENTQQLLRYFKVWFLMFFKHPLCYIEATWNQSYYVFMPDFDNVVYNQDVNAGIGVATDELKEYLNLHIPAPIDGLAITICSMYRMLNQMPVISTLNNLCAYVFLMFAISLFLKRKELKEYRLALVPLWLSFIFIFLAPMIVDQPRYSWAIFYLMPTIVAMYMHLVEKEPVDKNV